MASQPGSSSGSSSTQVPSLSRGQACIICRRKKMRCDGVRPFCGPCSLTRNPHHCEYTDKQGRTFTEVLEERLRLLKARIKELEEQREDAPILLRLPYPRRVIHSSAGSAPRVTSPARLSDAPETVGLAVQLVPNVGNAPEISVLHQEQEFQSLLHIFLPHVDRLHFVLHIPTLLQEISSPGNVAFRPHLCIVSSIALWALHIMGPNAEYAPHEARYLKLARDSLPGALASPIGRYRIQGIQSEVLLALYFFNDTHLIEGYYHLSAAVSSVLACGLHRLSANGSPPFSLLSPGLIPGGETQQLLDPPRNAVELAERVNLFWVVYALDCCWSVALGPAPAILDRSSSNVLIKTLAPMPLDLADSLSVERISLSVELSIPSFFDGTADWSVLPSPSTDVSFVIAAGLFQQATRIAAIRAQTSSGSAGDEDVEKLDQAIARFNAVLRAPNDPSSLLGSLVPNEGRKTILARTIGFASMIQLHFPFLGNIDSEEKCRTAVREIVRMIRFEPKLAHGQLDKVDPFFGILWLSAARVLINEMATLSSASASSSPASNVADISASAGRAETLTEVNREEIMQDPQQRIISMLRAQEITEDLETLLNTIRRLGETCPLVASQLEVLEGSQEGRMLESI